VDVVVTGTYSDGKDRQVPAGAGYEILGFDPDKEGLQAVAVVLNGKTALYEVSVLELVSIAVVPLKTDYAYGSFFSPDDIKVVGSYSDGTKKIIKWEEEYTVTPYEDELETLTAVPLKGGSHDLLVTAYNGVNELLKITVEDERVASISIGLPSGDIVLSVTGLQKELVISAARVYSNVSWYVDNEPKATNNENIFTIKAADYVLKKPHTLTFVGTRDDVEYSTDISFTVKWD
jgi:hypothetical protein